MNPMEEQLHNLNDIWKRINLQSDQITSIAKAQVASDARLQNLDDKVTQGFSDIKSTLQSMDRDHHRPKNWVGIGALTLTGIASASGYVYMLHKFNEVRLDRHDATLESRGEWLRESSAVHGVQQAQILAMAAWIDYLKKEVDKYHEFEMLTRERLAYLEGMYYADQKK